MKYWPSETFILGVLNIDYEIILLTTYPTRTEHWCSFYFKKIFTGGVILMH